MQRFRFLFLFLFCFCTLSSFAQLEPVVAPNDTLSPQIPKDTSWRYKGVIQLNVNQLSLSNWQGGGQNTLAGASFLKLQATYKRGKNTWDNRLDAGYGLIRQGDKNVDFQKSDDALELMSKYSHNLRKALDLAALLDFNTTIMPGYKYGKDSAGNPVRQEKLSRFMAPGYLISSLGLEYKPSDAIFVMFAPISGKFTFLQDTFLSNRGEYGVPVGKQFRAEFGANLKSIVKLKLMKNVNLMNDLSLFGNYKTLDRIDVDNLTDLLLTVNDIITAKVSLHMIYDDDIKIQQADGHIGPALQLKELISVGIQYAFI
jgi:hypothetical protein